MIDCYELLEKLEDEEIRLICANSDLSIFIERVKLKQYEKERKTLGRLDKKSKLVQKQLPIIALKLYKRRDQVFVRAVEISVKEMKAQVTDSIDKYLEIKSQNSLEVLSKRQLAEMYFFIKDTERKDMSEELFLVCLKMCGLILESDDKEEILQYVDIQNEIRELTNTYENEIQELTNTYEKQKRDALAIQKDKLELRRVNECEGFQKKIGELQDLIKSKECELENQKQIVQQYERQTIDEKNKLFEEWKKEFETSLEQTKTDADERHKEYLHRLECENELKILELQNVYTEKRRCIEKEYEEIICDLKQIKEQMESEIRDYQNQIETNQKVIISQEEHIESLKNTEIGYFANLEKRVLEHQIENIILERLKKEIAPVQQEIAVIQSPNSDHSISIEGKFIGTNQQCRTPIQNTWELFEDYKDNISLFFNMETDVAGTVLASIINGLAIIAENNVSGYLALCLSALLDARTPHIIYYDSDSDSLKSIIESIDNSNSQVISIKGVLDQFSVSLFNNICSFYQNKGKILFFSVSDIDELKIVSNSITKNGAIIDAESLLIVHKEDDLLINNLRFTDYMPRIDSAKQKKIFNSIFKKLVSKSIIKKSTAQKYSAIVQMYNEITEAQCMGNIMKKAIILACDVNDEEAFESANLKLQ